MSKTQNEPKIFEEYNFQEFLKLKKENEELKTQNNVLMKRHNEVIRKAEEPKELLKQLASLLTIEKSETSDLHHVNFDRHYAHSYVPGYYDNHHDDEIITLLKQLETYKENK